MVSYPQPVPRRPVPPITDQQPATHRTVPFTIPRPSWFFVTSLCPCITPFDDGLSCPLRDTDRHVRSEAVRITRSPDHPVLTINRTVSTEAMNPRERGSSSIPIALKRGGPSFFPPSFLPFIVRFRSFSLSREPQTDLGGDMANLAQGMGPEVRGFHSQLDPISIHCSATADDVRRRRAVWILTKVWTPRSLHGIRDARP